MDRLFVRQVRPARLRVWTPPDGPVAGIVEQLVIEYAGRVGHPSSYGLLGGSLSTSTHPVELRLDGEPFAATMAAREDAARFGLPAEYSTAVASALSDGVVVTVAAHGLASSSQLVFASLASALSRWLAAGLPDDPDVMWEQFGSLR